MPSTDMIFAAKDLEKKVMGCHGANPGVTRAVDGESLLRSGGPAEVTQSETHRWERSRHHSSVRKSLRGCGHLGAISVSSHH